MQRSQPKAVVSAQTADLTPINLIRTESVLSRFPVHSLSKKTTVDVDIRKKNADGEAVIKWQVSYSEKHGPAGQLAYKLDTLIINRKIEASGRPVPKLVRMGSLREMAEELGLGGNTEKLKLAFRQNAGAFVTMKISYRTIEGKRKTLEAAFTRYSVIFTGDTLPNNAKADCVYINLNDVYRDVLNEAPWRPQDYDYLRSLTPAAQRFYEIISARFNGMYRRSEESAGIRIAYSEYCAYAAQQRYFDYDHVKKQMYKVHQPHKESGYIASAKFEPVHDDEGHPDWLITYMPGVKAQNEYEYFTGKTDVLQSKLLDDRPRSVQVDHPLIGELTRRGIEERQARNILASLSPEQDVMEQLEYADWRIANSPAETFHNPPGFYISVLRENANVPLTFESSRRRRERELVERQKEIEQLRRQDLESAYEEYKRQQVERYISEQIPPEDHEALISEMEKAYVQQFKNAAGWPAETLRSVAMNAASLEISKRVPMLTIEQFAMRRETEAALNSEGM